jgi:hypothetical protein
MKFKRVTRTVAVLLFFGTTVYAQHEGGEKEGKPAAPQARQAAPQQHAQAPQPRAAQPKRQEQPRAAQPKQQEQPRVAQPKQQEQPRAAQPKQQEQPRAAQPRQQPQQRAQQPQQARQQAQPQRTEQQARSWQEKKGFAPQGSWQGHANFQQSRSQNWSSDHRTWAQRGGYGGYLIPQDRFSLSFGSGHFFRLGGLPSMYLGYPRFSYGGFSFLMVDPWPGDWPENWYSADDVYVGYNDGYYLYNRSYPQEAIALTIVL